MSSFPFLSKWLCGLRMGLFLLLIQSKALSNSPQGQESTSQERVLFWELRQWKGPAFGWPGRRSPSCLGQGGRDHLHRAKNEKCLFYPGCSLKWVQVTLLPCHRESGPMAPGLPRSPPPSCASTCQACWQESAPGARGSVTAEALKEQGPQRG